MKASEKPTHARPQFYAMAFFQLKEIAETYGYNLLIHGSMHRDLDLVAVPWIDEPKDEWEMINALYKHLTGLEFGNKEAALFSVLPGGRNSYVLNLNRGDRFNGYVDNQYYLDISVTPLQKRSS
tara:strand:- start:67145 stop:67516 length:372 start_codon:yes stop_codon:yes gene_type:complete